MPEAAAAAAATTTNTVNRNQVKEAAKVISELGEHVKDNDHQKTVQKKVHYF